MRVLLPTSITIVRDRTLASKMTSIDNAQFIAAKYEPILTEGSQELYFIVGNGTVVDTYTLEVFCHTTRLGFLQVESGRDRSVV